MGGVSRKAFSCAYDALGRLKERDRVSGIGDQESLSYAYDARGQLTSVMTNSSSSLIPHPSSLYSYDQIGNFTAMTRADAETNFTASAVNQYAGLAYNADGCLTALPSSLIPDTRYLLTYDSSCRLTSVSTGGVLVASYAYDPSGRRVKKTTPEAVTRYFYDDWNLIEERETHTNGTVTTTEYVWGKDVSESLDGEGGVGGLLYVKRGGSVYVPLYDQGGNIVAYVDGATGSMVAKYAYDGFGNTVVASGTLADAFRFRYSTKYTDPETGLIYYGYRYYAPSLGRWLTRDPLEEEGGLNLYAFCGNNGVNRYDADGRLNFITALGHYVLRSGERVTIPFADIDTSEVRPSQFNKVASILHRCRKDTYSIDDSMPISTMVKSLNQGLYLGVVTLKLSGDLFCVDGGYWRFAGKLSCSDDTYDFNRSNHRSTIGEALTFIGSLIPGKTYKIGFSGEKPIWEYGNCCKNKSR